MIMGVKKITVEHAKNHFSQILAQVEAGEDITIIRSGIPVARLVRMDKSKKRRELGTHRDSVWIADDFDAPLPAEILDSFEGKKPKGEDQGNQPGNRHHDGFEPGESLAEVTDPPRQWPER